MKKFKLLFLKALIFIKQDIWSIPIRNLPKTYIFLIRQLRILLLAIKGYKEDKCQVRASAMTYYTLLSLVPVLAMAFGISKGFGFEKLLEEWIRDNFSGQEELFNKIILFTRRLLDNTKGGVIAGFGLLVLFWAVIKLLSNIELSFNDIWKIKKSRSFFRKFSDYLAIMLFAPIFLIVSSSATVYISTHVDYITKKIEIIGFFSPLIFFLLQGIPYVLSWMLFTILYLVMPNTKVYFKSGLMAGIIAGTIYQVVQWVYINFQIGVASYNAIYGSFAALPLFLIWLQLSWLIVLLGAEFSFASQNVAKYEYEVDTFKLSLSTKRRISILILALISKNFEKENKAQTVSEISSDLEIPANIIRQVIYELVDKKLLSEVKTDNYEIFAFQPAFDINKLYVNYVIQKLEISDEDNFEIPQSDDYAKLNSILNDFNDLIKNSNKNILLKDL